jgi:hypothetical protein
MNEELKKKNAEMIIKIEQMQGVDREKAELE